MAIFLSISYDKPEIGMMFGMMKKIKSRKNG